MLAVVAAAPGLLACVTSLTDWFTVLQSAPVREEGVVQRERSFELRQPYTDLDPVQ